MVVRHKVKLLERDGVEIALGEELPLTAENTDFDNTTLIGALINETTSQKAIEKVFNAGLALNGNVIALHYLSGSGNTTMSNGTIFRIFGNFSVNSAAYSGYNVCFPTHLPFDIKITEIQLTCTQVSFDWVAPANAGPVQFDLIPMSMFHNGSNDLQTINIFWGNYSGNQISYGLNQFTFTPEDNMTFSAGNFFPKDTLLGFRWVKPSEGLRRINNFQNIVLDILVERV
jgi:hypothetical protein